MPHSSTHSNSSTHFSTCEESDGDEGNIQTPGLAAHSTLPGGLRSLEELDDMYDFEMDENFKSPEDMNETAHINDAGDTIMEEDMIMDEPPLAGMDMTHHDSLIESGSSLEDVQAQKPSKSFTRYSHRQGPADSTEAYEQQPRRNRVTNLGRAAPRSQPYPLTDLGNRRNEKRRASEMVPGGDVVWKLSAIDDTSSVLQLAAPTHQDIVNTHHQPTNHMHNTETNQPPEMLSQARQVPELKAPINTLSQGPSQLYENMNLGKVQDQSLNSDLDSVNGEASSPISESEGTILAQPVMHANSSVHHNHLQTPSNPGLVHSEGKWDFVPVQNLKRRRSRSPRDHLSLRRLHSPQCSCQSFESPVPYQKRYNSSALNQHSTQQAESLQSFVDTRQHKPQDPPHFTGTPENHSSVRFSQARKGLREAQSRTWKDPSLGDRYPTPKDHDRSTSLRTMILSKAPPIPSGFHHSDSKNISSLSPTPVGSSNQLPQLFRSEDEIQLTSSTTPISHLKVPSRLFDTEGNRTISNRQSRQVFRPTISERREPFLGTSRSSYPAAPAPIDLSCPRSSRKASYHQTTPAEPPLSSHKSSERRTPIAGPSRGPFPPAPLTMDHSSMMDISPSSVSRPSQLPITDIISSRQTGSKKITSHRQTRPPLTASHEYQSKKRMKHILRGSSTRDSWVPSPMDISPSSAAFKQSDSESNLNSVTLGSSSLPSDQHLDQHSDSHSGSDSDPHSEPDSDSHSDQGVDSNDPDSDSDLEDSDSDSDSDSERLDSEALDDDLDPSDKIKFKNKRAARRAKKTKQRHEDSNLEKLAMAPDVPDQYEAISIAIQDFVKLLLGIRRKNSNDSENDNFPTAPTKAEFDAWDRRRTDRRALIDKYIERVAKRYDRSKPNAGEKEMALVRKDAAEKAISVIKPAKFISRINRKDPGVKYSIREGASCEAALAMSGFKRCAPDWGGHFNSAWNEALFVVIAQEWQKCYDRGGTSRYTIKSDHVTAENVLLILQRWFENKKRQYTSHIRTEAQLEVDPNLKRARDAKKMLLKEKADRKRSRERVRDLRTAVMARHFSKTRDLHRLITELSVHSEDEVDDSGQIYRKKLPWRSSAFTAFIDELDALSPLIHLERRAFAEKALSRGPRREMGNHEKKSSYPPKKFPKSLISQSYLKNIITKAEQKELNLSSKSFELHALVKKAKKLQ